MEKRTFISLLVICLLLFTFSAFAQPEEASSDTIAMEEAMIDTTLPDSLLMLPAPEPPQNFRAIDVPNDDGAAVTIQWEMSPSEDVEKYEIWRESSATGKEMLVMSVFNTPEYQLTRDAIFKLEEEIPEEVLKKMRIMRGQLFPSKEEFLLNLAERIGADNVNEYQSVIVRYAREEFEITDWVDTYKLTEQSIINLERNIPTEVLEKLTPFENKEYSNNKRFLQTIAGAIGVEKTLQYKSLFLKEGFVHNESIVYTYSGKSITQDGRESEWIRSEVQPNSEWFHTEKISVFVAIFLFMLGVAWYVTHAKRGKEYYIRPISGINAVDEAVGRATEMGRPILYVPGLSGLRDVATIAGLIILGDVAKKAAEYDTPLIVPIRDYLVYPVAQEIVKEAYMSAGRPDAYNEDSVFFLTTGQFAYVAGVAGIMAREKPATNFFMGMFWAESLILTEKGNQEGSIQIAGTDADTQLPFFITTCDYTLIGEELYAASAYISREPRLLGTIKAQDLGKLLIVVSVVIGTVLTTLDLEFFMSWFPAR